MMLEQELRDRLGAVDVPPSRLDAEVAVTAGRRGVARRRAALAGGGAMLAVGVLVAVPTLVFGSGGTDDVMPASPVTTECAVTPLAGPPGMTNVRADAVDPTGRFIVGQNISEPEPTNKTTGKIDGVPAAQPVMWTDGRVQVLPASNRAVRPSAVNADGTMVAVAGDGKEWDTMLRYEGGVPQKLSPPPGTTSFGLVPEINAAGDIVASSNVGVVLWKAGSTTGVKLPLPKNAEVRHLTDDGRIIGEVVSKDVQTLTTYIWTEAGAGTKLTGPKGQSLALYAARGDWATGNLWPSGTVARWNLRTGEITDLKLHTPANAINAKGWILADDTVRRADATVKLKQIAGSKEPAFAADVSDTGLVVGSRLTANPDGSTGSKGAITWNCADRK
ncbi:hypothetical protein [Actinoplanes sp. NBRC 103695]|uniref:hypothetical protein n=1 Tax=Actinoplanes sp. NBRC 103695 TaxID=3032202 RepID=UPI0024A2AAD8|nr:hypothetical protein [Actinoplanes sp. NBRC 103695]GLY94478.1 hypothetical protein Acsp02_17340 [Actinoplanes sp. NBRC 103695]